MQEVGDARVDGGKSEERQEEGEARVRRDKRRRCKSRWRQE